ncbi:fibronectin type III domain-containing protein [Cohnella silvisoli]|uniref:Fibronectin type III domain-containing protein n=1 Tax=Cohnella silvisoli TaxID=2873699 RepID=A0ABV1L2F4_9BACL|nr:fibronectin type III domain-containing protein [Cohnella silvisoli]MCD9025782.1 fibronectin type III domain-containing protein [Cohnella silvisoli]
MKTFRLRMSYLLIASLLVMLFVPQIAHAEEATEPTPIISGVSPADGAMITESFTLISFGLGIPLADTGSIIIMVDNQIIDPNQVNYMHGLMFTYRDGLQNGTHSLIIRVLDRDMNLLKEYSGNFNVRLSIWKGGNLEAANIESTSLHLSWTPADESLGYRIYGNSILLGAVNGNITSFDATDLYPKTTYNFKVEAERSDGSWTTDGPALTVTTFPQDRINPIIESVSPADGDELTTAWPKITAKAYDEDSGINLSMSMVGVDDKIVPFSYDEASKTLTAIAPRLPSGTHSLLIFVTDNDGNKTQYTSSFTVKYETGEPFLERSSKLRAALDAGDPADAEDVRRLSSEFAELDEINDQSLIDPIWNKIKLMLPESVDKAQLKRQLFHIIVTIGSLPYDQQESGLKAILSDPEFLRTLKTIASAGGETNLTMEDILSFIFGDGNNLRGIEGHVLYYVSQLSPIELFGLLGDNQKMMDVLMKAITNQLSQTTYYKISSILRNLNVTAHDIQSTLLNFQQKLNHDGPAVHAMTFAYIRLMAQESVKVSSDGYEHSYSLKVASIDIPPQALIWKKVSGSSQFSITPDGVVSIPEEAYTATAVIQAALVNPYSGVNKVIFQKEVTITADRDPTVIFQSIMKTFESKLGEVQSKLNVATTLEEQTLLFLDLVNTGKVAIEQIKPLSLSEAVITDAIETITNGLVEAVSSLLVF